MAPVTRTGPRLASHSLGPLPQKGPRVCISTIIQTGPSLRPALLCSPELLFPGVSLHHRRPGWPGAVWKDQPLLSRHLVKQVAQAGGSLHKARQQGSTQLPTGQHPEPQAFQRVHGHSHWEAEACGRAVNPAQPSQPPDSVPSRGAGASPGDSSNQRRAVRRDRVAPCCLRRRLQSTD